jgi:hypothetical protein
VEIVCSNTGCDRGDKRDGTRNGQDRSHCSMTGPFTTTGKQIAAGARFYVQQHGAAVAVKKIELVVRDDAGVSDNSKRIAQELLVNDKVNIPAGFDNTPVALPAAPLATETKTPMIVMAAAAASVTERSPYIVRTSFAQAQPVVVIADWEAKQGLRRRSRSLPISRRGMTPKLTSKTASPKLVAKCLWRYIRVFCLPAAHSKSGRPLPAQVWAGLSTSNHQAGPQASWLAPHGAHLQPWP